MQSCDERYDIDSPEACAMRCDSMDRCIGFSYAPLNGDRNHEGVTVCTVYEDNNPTGMWTGTSGEHEQVFCRRETGTTLDGCFTSNSFEGENPLEIHDDPEHEAAVRCCSMDGDECQTQDLPDAEEAPVLNMDGDETGHVQACHNSVLFHEAQSICSRAGKRLCTVDEIDAETCCGTGCWHDHRAIWIQPEVMIR